MSNSACTICSSTHHNSINLTCKTEPTVRCYNIEWEIKNFRFIQKQNGQYISSPNFVSSIKPRIEWTIHLYPNGSTNVGTVGVFFYNVSSLEVVAKLNFALLNKKREKKHFLSTGPCLVKSNLDWGFQKILSREELLDETNGLLPDGTLTMVCELQIIDETKEHCIYSDNKNMNKLSEDLEQLFKNSDWSDVTISIGSKKYPVHKYILGARSSVFSAIFKHEMLENKTNVIEISDIEPNIMEEVLLFIYSGKCPGVNEMAAEILPAAEKYDLGDLKQQCEQTLIDQLDKENAVKTLIIADLYNVNRLRHKALNYIGRHALQILNSSAWKELSVSHPYLEIDGLKSMVQHSVVLNSGSK